MKSATLMISINGLLAIAATATAHAPPPQSRTTEGSAAAEARQVAQNTPSVEAAYQVLSSGDAATAARMFQRILMADERNLAAQEGMVWSYMKMGDVTQAALMADKRLAMAPDDSWRQKRLQILGQLPARRAEAIAGYREWLATHPNDATQRAQLARLLSWTPGKLSDAIDEYRRAIAQGNREHDTLLGLAQSLSWSGKLPEAAAAYDLVLVSYPEDADALLGRAQVARWTSDRGTAHRLLTRGTTAHPRDARFPAEMAQVDLDANRPARALSDARQAVALDPGSSAAQEALTAASAAAASHVSVRVSGSDESTGFRRDVVGVPVEFYPLRDTRVRIEPNYERDSDDFSRLNRPSIGAGIREDILQSFYVEGTFRDYFPEGSGSTQAYGGELGYRATGLPLAADVGIRRRSLLDAPTGYEDIAYLTTVGSGGTTVAGIRDHLQTSERYVGFSFAPHSGFNVYGSGSSGDLSDGNRSRSIAAGLGANVFALAGVLPRQSLTLKYDYFFLGFDQPSALYFSPGNFRVHTVSADWRYRATSRVTFGLEGGVPINSGGSTGYLAGGFFHWQSSPAFSLEGRIRVLDDTQYRIVAFTFGPQLTF